MIKSNIDKADILSKIENKIKEKFTDWPKDSRQLHKRDNFIFHSISLKKMQFRLMIYIISN